MAKRDKKKMVKPEFKLRSVAPDMPPAGSKEMWEAAKPIFLKSRKGNVIVGTIGELSPKKYYEMFFNSPVPSCGPSMTEQLHESIERGDYLTKEEMVRRMGMRHYIPRDRVSVIHEYPLTPEESFEVRPRRIGYNHAQKAMDDFWKFEQNSRNK